MIETSRFNEVIRAFLDGAGITYTLYDGEVILVDRTSMCSAPITKGFDEQASYDAVLGVIRTLVPGTLEKPRTAMVNWGSRSDEHLGVEVWVSETMLLPKSTSY